MPFNNIFYINSITHIIIIIFIANGKWHTINLQEIVPLTIMEKIIQNFLIVMLKDKILFSLSNNRNFILKDVWDLDRRKQNHIMFPWKIWANNIPSTLSIMVWRIWNNFVIIDSLLIKKGLYLPSKSQCCFHIEISFHVYINGLVPTITTLTLTSL